MVSLFFLSQLHPWAEWSCSSWEPSADLATRRGEFLLCCSHSSSSGVSFNIPFHPSPTFLHPHSHFVLFAHGGLVLYLPSPHWAHSTVQKGPDDSVHLVPNSPYRLGPRKWQSDIEGLKNVLPFLSSFEQLAVPRGCMYVSSDSCGPRNIGSVVSMGGTN